MSKTYVVVLFLRRNYFCDEYRSIRTDDSEIFRSITLAKTRDDAVVKTLAYHARTIEAMRCEEIGELILRVTPINMDESQAFYSVFDTKHL